MYIVKWIIAKRKKNTSSGFSKVIRLFIWNYYYSSIHYCVSRLNVTPAFAIYSLMAIFIEK